MNFNLFAVALSALVSVILAAAAGEGPENCPVKAGAGPYSYDYTSDTGPANWGDIPGYETCGTGQIQSPIDFSTHVNYKDLMEGPHPNISMANMKFSPGTYNWAMNCYEAGTCGYTMIGGVKYYVANIHMHSPSEHYLNGKQYPFEAHIVHASEDGRFAVIATMFDYAPNDTYASIVCSKKPANCNKSFLMSQILKNVMKDKEMFHINLGSIIEKKAGYCTYTGSLTTPPCTEGVQFYMSLNVQPIAPIQVDEYRVSTSSTFYGNARPLNPVNGRMITCFI